MRLTRWFPLVAATALWACSGSSSNASDVTQTDVADVLATDGTGADDVPATDGTVTTDVPVTDVPAIQAWGIETPCTDALAAVYTAPATLPASAGSIIACAPDGDLTKDGLQARLTAVGVTGVTASAGAKVWRISYATKRGNDKAGFSTAIVYVPETPAADKVPIVVASHGSRGQAGVCAPSMTDPAAEYVRDDFEAQVLPLVASGFAVIAPDLAGYAAYGSTDNPPSGYAESKDVGYSTLDGARAMKQLFPSHLTSDVVLTGHSQGGHTAIASLALAGTYAPDLSIKAVSVFAPLWLSQRSWGAVLLLADLYPIATSPAADAVSIWYHYTHAELLDGPGEGLKLFQPEKAAAVKKFVDEVCWSKNYPMLEALGTTLKDVFTQEFMDAVMLGSIGSDCPADEPAKSVCTKWISRYTGDRPHLTGAAAKTPILIAYGGKDDTIPPDRFQCALDRLTEDQATTSFCYDPDADHGGVVARQAAYVTQWIASQTLGTAITATCPSTTVDTQATCANPPPND